MTYIIYTFKVVTIVLKTKQKNIMIMFLYLDNTEDNVDQIVARVL